MRSPCAGCAAPCCVGRRVPLGDDEVERLAAALGLDAGAFAARDEGGWRLRRGEADACVFAVPLGAELRCGIHDARPRSCRVYPYHVAVRGDGVGATLGDDAACPPARARAWQERIEDERDAIVDVVRADAAAAERRAPRRLPLAAASPCFGCTTPCCFEYVVPVSARDLWRLTRALGVPWAALVRVRPTPSYWMESFCLDSGGARWAFQLPRRPSGACGLLLSLDGAHRCGVHAARPLACRVYPFDPGTAAAGPPALLRDAVCPPSGRARVTAEARRLAEPMAAELDARARYLRVIARWDDAARARPRAQPYTVDDFVRWTFSLYDALERLARRHPEDFAAAATALIDGFPLPSDLAPGC